jgi:hypothetical protein
MNPCTRNLIAVSTNGSVSPTFTITPGGAAVLVSLMDAGSPGPHDGGLPASAFARIQKLNSFDTFNDLAFIGSGRGLSALLEHPGTYRVQTPEVTEGLAFGVDITCADFAVAPPGELSPGKGTVAPANTTTLAPFPNTFTTRQTLADDGTAVDIIAGINVESIASIVILSSEGSPAFPQFFPETAVQTFHLMYGGKAMAVTVGLQMCFPPPRADHAE